MRRLSVLVRLPARVGRFVYGLVWLLVVVLLLAGCASRNEYVDTTAILARVRPGDDREQVFLALSDAWFHSRCNLITKVDDVFLYGPRNREKVTLIIIRSAPSQDRLVVESSGSLEGYALNAPIMWETCDPPLLQAFETPQAPATATP